MAVQRPSTVRSAAFRRSALSLAKAFSIGLKSGREMEQRRAGGFDESAHLRSFMAGQIVHDDDVAWAQGRRQHLLDPGEEALSVHRTVQKHRCNKARKRESADKSHGFPMTVRNGGAATLALWRPATKACHFRGKAAFIDKDQVFGVKIVLALDPILARGLHISALLLAGMGSLFLCV